MLSISQIPLSFMLQIVKDWVKHITRVRGYPDQMVDDANALIFTFGSYRLGVSIFLVILLPCLATKKKILPCLDYIVLPG